MYEYYVNYGQGSFVGRFTAGDRELSRDCEVIVRTPRGDEWGSVLDRVTPAVVDQVDFPRGEVLSLVTDQDRANYRDLQQRGEALLDDANRLVEQQGIPVTFLDVEVLFDGQTAVLQGLHWSECDITGLLDQLSDRHRLAVRLHDLTGVPKKESHGCSTCGSEKSGCDSCGTGGGCSTGSCSKGSMKNAEEMTQYFAQLRRQMEQTQHRTPLDVH